MKESEFLKGNYEIDISLTLLFSSIYGEAEYSRFKQTTSLPNYKKQFIKLLNTLRKSFKETSAKTDSYHLAEIEKMVDEELTRINKAKSVEEIYKTLVVFFPKLCFILIGQVPQNFSKRSRDNRNRWELNSFRQIQYSQSRKQKHKFLLHLLENEQIEELKNKNYKGVIEEYKNSKKNKETFIDWFLRTYPEIYLRLFKETN